MYIVEIWGMPAKKPVASNGCEKAAKSRFLKKHAKTAKYKKEALGTARGVGKRGLWFFALAPDREVPYTSIP